MVLALSVSGCGVIYRGVSEGVTAINQSQFLRQGRYGQLTELEVAWAQTAWKYIENNTQVSTGLVNNLDKYPTTNMEGVADYIISLLAARELELITSKEYDERLTLVLRFLNTMDLSYGRAPNRVYSTETGKKVNYANQEQDIGYSSLEVGRVLVALALVKQYSPEFSEYVDKAVLRWNFCHLVGEDGELYSATVHDGQLQRHKDGRLGIEEYASYGYLEWQIIPFKAMSIEPYDVATIYDVDILFDGRDPREFESLRPVYSTPYLRMGLEYNWDYHDDVSSTDASHSYQTMSAIADSIYRVQELRWENERIYTARAEHVTTEYPHFVYDAIYALGTPWFTVAPDATSYDELALVSTRVAFQMWVLWETDYTDRLVTLVKELYDEQRGWYEGRYELTSAYERSITLKTNAGVLEALLYKKQGKLSKQRDVKEYKDVRFDSRFDHPGNCFVETFR
ncbi:DUF3131 domain-containing protein [Vibrio maerlii]|uniref:DUF3131 domain-containing protein n=1 Tax=Vibrio maerlii TaxID=2231648 RepID=UPI001F1433D0|nr:DUF3131 domain-containing protein [Vibrio maerlii]